MAPDLESDGEEDAGNVQLPCFEKATTIKLDLCNLGIALPSLGIFTRLINLSLSSVQFRGPCDLGNVVSWPRCPCLQSLSMCDTWGCGLCNDLSIYSESLLQLELSNCALSQLTIVTPILQKLSVYDSLPPVARDPSEPVAKITAPQMVSLVWKNPYDPRHFHLGNLGQLQKLETNGFFVHGHQVFKEHNLHCLRLLQRFQVLYSLHLLLVSCKDICNDQFLLGDIVVLPQITFLHLDFYSRGHAFGATLFHLLRMCISLRRLSLLLSTFSIFEEESACPSGCFCDQPENWKSGELVLGHLEDVCITGLQGAEHEVAFVQRFLGWATVLKSLRITFDNKMTEGKIGEFREALAGFSRPETCVQFNTSDSK